MVSYLVDLVLLAALVVTALKCGRMMRELKAMKEAGSDFARALEDSDRSINRAAEAVVSLKHEVLDVLSKLQSSNGEAADLAERLEKLVKRADWHVAAQSDVTEVGTGANSVQHRSQPQAGERSVAFTQRFQASLAS